MSAGVRWKITWENDLEPSDHAELSQFFRATYGPTGEFNAKPFETGRSWAGARPERRAIAYDSKGIASHMGLLRRFIRVGDTDLLVAELGLYGVRPDLEGLGIAHSIRALAPALQELAVPFAFGTVRHAMRNHVERFCRDGISNIVTGIRVRSTLPDALPDMPSTRTEDVLVLVFPIGRPMSEWPSGSLIERNGCEL
ncbi:NodA family N-acyltransferase [Rhizobium johnstonii]|jgi:nodulation protein A|uniref:NodA family N-acyltransferase n=1 Tax=Rhizobium TaxID=379 RepID=UPI0010311B95|nr:NodA family N-acyltransferase [Rhizobium leguminosarum]TAU83861.1 NodA family N-acyltransferase [Rhizobium leguminosarum]TAV81367.1 NodA family N-acyltransferase [Rhizobium leguminosarum]TAV83041.1 NodA family N-acyltransferase [Rhizobium leguminosarum]TAW25641.1 NodA family N-acyltransferase [Rhizobium leguminosarum]TAX10022.1 NodA family N-acyltransferase [Rhizobium leguminosarum]